MSGDSIRWNTCSLLKLKKTFLQPEQSDLLCLRISCGQFFHKSNPIFLHSQGPQCVAGFISGHVEKPRRKTRKAIISVAGAWQRLTDSLVKAEEWLSRRASICWSKGSHNKLMHSKAGMEGRIPKSVQKLPEACKVKRLVIERDARDCSRALFCRSSAATGGLTVGKIGCSASVALAGLLGPNDRPTLTLFSHPLDRPTDHLEISLFDNNTIEQRSRDTLDQSQSWLTPNTYVLCSVQRLVMRRLPTAKPPTPTAPIPMTASMADFPP